MERLSNMLAESTFKTVVASIEPASPHTSADLIVREEADAS